MIDYLKKDQFKIKSTDMFPRNPILTFCFKNRFPIKANYEWSTLIKKTRNS